MALCPWQSALYFAASIGVGPLTAYTTKLLASVIDALIAIITGAGEPGALWAALGRSAALTAALALISALKGYLTTVMPLKINKEIDQRIIKLASGVPYFEYLSPGYQSGSGAATDNATHASTGIVSYVCSMISAFSTMISYTVMLSTFGGTVAAVGAVALVSIACIVNIKIQEKLRKERTLYHELDLKKSYYSSLYNRGDAAQEMALFGSDAIIDPAIEKYYQHSVNIRRNQELYNARLSTLLTLVQALVAGAGTVLVLLSGGLVSAGALTAVIVAMRSVMGGASSIGSYMGAMLGYRRCMEDFLAFEDKYKRPEKAKETIIPPDMDALAVDASHVSFAYGDHIILRDINLRIKKGEHVAIVGENGAGKTTLINILLGLYPNGGGSVKVFGTDPEALVRAGEKLPAYALFQTFGRFNGLTVGENVTLGFAPFDAKRAGRIDPFLETLKPDMIAGEQFSTIGRNFSGGEWQKIALARCDFAGEAPLVILDEPTASLDPMAEMEVFNNTMQAFSKRAVILITHRLGAVRRTDRIYVMRDGVFIEEGSHDELMARDGYYAAMFREQASWYQVGEGGAQ